jgi:hypothetical protein
MTSSTIPNLKTASPKFSKPQLEVIHAAKAEAEGITNRMELLHDRRSVKQVLAESSNNFAAGELDLQSAVLSSLATSAATDQVIADLRGACKVRLRQVYLAAKTFIDAADLHRIEQIKAAAGELENDERSTSKNLGIADDDFQPSPRLEQLRETHRRAIENFEMDSRRPANSADFKRLLDAIS